MNLGSVSGRPSCMAWLAIGVCACQAAAIGEVECGSDADCGPVQSCFARTCINTEQLGAVSPENLGSVPAQSSMPAEASSAAFGFGVIFEDQLEPCVAHCSIGDIALVDASEAALFGQAATPGATE